MSTSAVVVGVVAAGVAANASKVRKKNDLKKCEPHGITDYQECKEYLKQREEERKTAVCEEIGITDPEECRDYHSPGAEAFIIVVIAVSVIGIAGWIAARLSR